MAKVRHDEIIESGLFQKEIQASQEFVKVLDGINKQFDELLKKSKEELIKLDTTKLKSIQSFNQEVEKTKKVLTEKDKIDKQILATQERIKIAQTNRGKQLALLREEQRKVSQATKLEIRENSSLSNAYEKLSARLIRLRTEQKNLAAQGKTTGKEFRTLTKEVQTLDAKLKAIDSTVGQNQRNVGNYKSAVSGLNSQFQNLTSTLGTTLGLFGAVNLIKGAVNTIKEFEKSNATLAGVLDTNLEGIKGLTDEALRLGAATSKSASEVTALQESLARLGFTQKEIIELTPALIDGSVALNSDLAQTAELVGAVVRSYDDLSTANAPEIVDAMTVATQKSALSFEKLQTAIPIVAGAANAANIDFNTMTALLGKLSDAGIDASSSATALRNIFIESASQGLSYEQILDKIANSSDKLTAATDEFGKRAAVSANVLAASIKGTKDLKDALDEAGGAAARVAETQLNTLDGSIKLAESAWEGFILSLNDGGGFITGTLRGIIDFFAKNVETIGNLLFGAAAGFIAFKVAQVTLNAVMTITTGITKAYTFVLATLNGETKLATIASTVYSAAQTALSTVVGLLTGKIKLATIAQKAWNAVTSANPIGLVISAVVALIGVLEILGNSYDEQIEKTKELNEKQNQFFEEREKNRKEEELARKKEIEKLRASGAEEDKILEARRKNAIQSRKDIIRENALANSDIKKNQEELIKATSQAQKSLESIRTQTQLEILGVPEEDRENLEKVIKTIKDSGRDLRTFDELGAAIEKINLAEEQIKKRKEEIKARDKEDLDLQNDLLALETKRADLNKQAAAEKVKQTEEEKKAARAALIASINDEIARQKILLIQSEKNSEEELNIKKKLEDLKAKLSIASATKITKNQRELIKLQAQEAKKELQEAFEVQTFETIIDNINSLYGELLQLEESFYTEGLTTQDEYKEEALKIEIERLNAIKEARIKEGKDILEQQIEINKAENELDKLQAEKTIKTLEESKKKQLKKEEVFFKERAIALKQRAIEEKDIYENLDEFLVGERIAQLEQEQVIINEAADKRKKAQEDAAKKDQKLAEEIAKKNQELAEADAQRRLEIEEELADLKLQKKEAADAKELESRQEFYNALDTLADAAAEAERERIQKTIEAINEEINARKNRVKELERLANEENSNAAETIAFEERRIAELEREKQKQQEKEKILELTLAAFKTYSAELSQGKNPGQALSGTIQNLTLLSTLIRSLPSFDVGTEKVKSNSNVDGKGGSMAIIHDGERILTEEQNSKLDGISNEELAELGSMYKQGFLTPNYANPNTYINTNDLSKIEKELKNIRNDFSKLKLTKEVDYDKITNTIYQTIYTTTGKETRASKLKKF